MILNNYVFCRAEDSTIYMFETYNSNAVRITFRRDYLQLFICINRWVTSMEKKTFFKC